VGADLARWSPRPWSSRSLIDRQLGAKAEASLYASIINGQLEVTSLGVTDWQRIQDLVSTYADLRLGGTDASVVALAERHGAVRIATLNRRHFAVVRPRHAAAFELLPLRFSSLSAILAESGRIP
jgi:hypothetical protein